MSNAYTIDQGLRSIFWPTQPSWIKQSGLVLLGVAFLTLISQCSIPWQPVPLTFQTAAVILMSMAFGARYAGVVVITYLLAAMAGMPVLANFHSLWTTQFTAGYLVGFVPAAFITGYLAEKGAARHVWSCFLIACLGATIIFACGLAKLATLMGWQQAFAVGCAPFLLTEPLKLAAISYIVPKLWVK